MITEQVENKDIEEERLISEKVNYILQENILMSIESILKSLNSFDENENIIIKFIIFYNRNKRHRYSNVAVYINNVAVEDEQVASFLNEALKETLRYIHINKSKINGYIKYVDSMSDSQRIGWHLNNRLTLDKLIENLEKLNDHISLEEQRIVFSQKRENRIFSTLINDLNSQVETLINESVTVYEEKVRESQEELKSVRQEMNGSIISILGIFCAVVMVFFGGLTALGNILSTMNKASSIRVIFMSALVGVIIFNVIFMLLYFIAKILDKSIATNDLMNIHRKCYRWDEEEERTIIDDSAVKKYRKILKSPIRRLNKRYPIVFYFNSLMICIMGICAIMWSIKKFK